MNQELITQFLNDEPFKYERMCGLTNFVYKVTTQKMQIIFRKYTSTFSIFQDRKKEVRLQKELANLGLAPNVLYSDDTQRIEEYLPYNSVSLSQIKADYIQVAKMLGNFHKLYNHESIKGIYTQSSIKQWLQNQQLQQKIIDIINQNCQGLSEEFNNHIFGEVQQKINQLLEDECFTLLPLVLSHNDLNSTNFLRDERTHKYHLIDFEFAGLNYPGYELANFFQEMEWDYTHVEPPYFKLKKGWSQELKQAFLQEYWIEFAGSPQIPDSLLKQIQIGGILQNYFWLMIGVLSFQKEENGIDLVQYIMTRLSKIKQLNL